eukprot:6133247-Lingulodinium_polyedra.AAC.1
MAGLFWLQTQTHIGASFGRAGACPRVGGRGNSGRRRSCSAPGTTASASRNNAATLNGRCVAG